MRIPVGARNLVSLAGLLLALPFAAAADKNLADYPLRVSVVRARARLVRGIYTGWGSGNVVDGQSIRGFDFEYECSFPIRPTAAGLLYAGRWKK
jgi:hypothetical protein